MGTECQKNYCEEDKQLLDEAEERARQEETNDRVWEEYAKEMPAIERANEEWAKEEAQSKETLVQQANESKNLDLKVNPDDYPKAVPSIQVKGFDFSKIVSDERVKEVISENPIIGFSVRFLPGKIPSIEFPGEGRPVRLVGEKTSPVLGQTIPNPKTGEKYIKIHEPFLKDTLDLRWIDQKEYDEKKDSPEFQKTMKEQVIIATIAHEVGAHVFGPSVLSKETQDRLKDMFQRALERYKNEEPFSPYIPKNLKDEDIDKLKWEYFGEGLAWSSEPKHFEELSKKEPELHSLVAEIKDECASFVKTSQKLILVRRGKV